MGSGCCRSDDYEEVESGEDGLNVRDRYLLEEKLMQSGFISHAAILNCSDGKLRASVPGGFVPDRSGIKDIIAALKGNTSGLEKRSVSLGGSTAVCTPGKLEEGKAIYGSDGKNGGCVILKTKSCLLIAFYVENAEAAVRLAEGTAQYLEDNGR